MPLLNHEMARGKVYEIMFEFCKYCYHLANNYLQLIIKFTVAHMQLRNEDSLLALSLWETIGTEYLDRIGELKDRINDGNQLLVNLVLSANRDILPEIMSLFLILN